MSAIDIFLGSILTERTIVRSLERVPKSRFWAPIGLLAGINSNFAILASGLALKDTS